MQREIWLMSGPRDRRVPLSIESRYDVTVRAAYRPSEDPPSRFEQLLEISFNRLGLIFGPIVVGLVATLIVAQVYLHYHPVLR